jgi:hypothetical protein
LFAPKVRVVLIHDCLRSHFGTVSVESKCFDVNRARYICGHPKVLAQVDVPD